MVCAMVQLRASVHGVPWATAMLLGRVMIVSVECSPSPTLARHLTILVLNRMQALHATFNSIRYPGLDLSSR
ncbi:hypothetical protein QBC45DRAFT_424404 [Copromyces sp. CBS 386.78]|nr:hypothetical protein QBC45DRAFT_424404 [Copromyces sp. CBS 386.78]